MRILVLTPFIPSRYKGGEIRLLQLMKHLSRDHEITIWAINRRGTPKKEIAADLPDCKIISFKPAANRGRIEGRLRQSEIYRSFRDLMGRFFSPLPLSTLQILEPKIKKKFSAFIAKNEFDIIHLNLIMPWVYLPDKLKSPVLLNKDNVWETIREQEFHMEHRAFQKFLNWIEWRKTARYEKMVVEKTDFTVVVSEEDRHHIQAVAPGKRITVVPNGVDTGYFTGDPMHAKPFSLVFTGTMSWLPNIDAMLFFYAEIFPKILEQHPQTTLKIVGMQPPPDIQALGQHPNITVTGEVPDIRPYIEEASVVVVPLRAGSGTRLKILEALSMQKAVISTTIGAEGLNTEEGVHLSIADKPKAFADAVCLLLNDEALRSNLGRQGRQLVEEQYDWSILAKKLDAVYRELLEARK